MCGIAGIFEFGTATGGVEEALLVAMGETIRHRGPDDDGTWVDPERRVGFAHRRLAIVDPRGGAQPMFGAGGECLVFNGEIYNYPALRRRLEAEGVAFATECDTEVILHLYRRHGAAMVERLVGMFGLALWDPASRELLLARDPIGEKPVYWAERGGRLVFGSEIKAVLAHPAVEAEVDADAVAPYFANLVTPAPSTLFAGIRKLEPGTILRCRREGARISRYAPLTPGREFDPSDSLDAAAARVRELFDTSIDDRLMSDVPVGVLLSGGLDSTALVASLSARGRSLPSFSIGYAGRHRGEERDHARRVARQFGTEHHEFELGEDQALGFLPDLIHHQDEPLGDPVAMPLHFVCGLARRQGVKVVLGGEGADELFWGYPWYAKTMRIWPLIRATLALPETLRRPIPLLAGDRGKGYPQEILGAIAAGRPLPMHCPVGLPRTWRQRILGGPAPLGWSPSDPAPGAGPRKTLAFDTQEYEFGLRLPELLLMRIDRFSMSNGVECRAPFLAPDLVDYVYRLPVGYKLRRGQGKVVFRRAVSGLVPDWVLDRPKQGFAPPVVAWLAASFGALLRELLRDPELTRWIDPVATLRLLEAGQIGAWPVLNFALWHRYWIRGEPLDDLIGRTAGAAGANR
jgi:asparagine synthase (glutamine-hydrolysing)